MLWELHLSIQSLYQREHRKSLKKGVRTSISLWELGRTGQESYSPVQMSW